MFFPRRWRAGGAFWVFVPERRMQMDPAEDENVEPAVGVEVVHVGKHAVGGARRRWEFHWWIERVFGREGRSFVPKGTGDDIDFAVAIDVAGGDAVAIVFVGQDLFAEVRCLSLGSNDAVERRDDYRRKAKAVELFRET